MSKSNIFDPAMLTQFTGTLNWYAYGMGARIMITDGTKYVADTAGAYWLLDEISLTQLSVTAVRVEEFQVWELKVKDDNSAELICEDGNGKRVYTKTIPYTDFPACGIRFYFLDNVLLLPSEY